MSPLVSAPNRGYADYQRVGNYDTGTLWTVDTGPGQTLVTSPVLDVSRFAYLSGHLTCNTNQCSCAVLWWADAAATISIGARVFRLSDQIGGTALIRLPNLGPYCNFQFTQAGAPTFAIRTYVIATNRVHPLEFIPGNPVLIDQQTAAIGASSTSTVYPSDYYAGPVSVWYLPAYASGDVNIQVLTSGGTWDYIARLANSAAGSFLTTMIAPPGAWRVIVSNNTAGASTYTLGVTPPTTGAS